ncbi:uncharacterized protein [Pocillopora verrucosa]|uniref:uncharacterized protein isoform X2 n=1 Tax=Pocillopora verrucosa TaxID=203993 RepID=UPI00333E97AF
MEASLSKVTQSNSGSKQGKSVVVLLSSDVDKSHGMVYLPNFSAQKALRKKEKGQFNDNVLFTKEMTEEDVRREIISHFPYLKDQSFWCASAVDNHQRLEFHGSPRIWNGMFIKRTIKGNSALYILTQNQPPEGPAQGQHEIVVPQDMPSPATAGSSQGVLVQRAGRVPLEMPPGESSVQWQMTADDLSKALQEPTDEWSSQQIPMFTLCSNKKSMLKERKNDQDAQQGLPMVQPVVSPLVKRKKGNYGLAINQAALQNQGTKVTIPAPAPASAPASAPIQLVYFPATQTSMRRTVSPGQLPQLTIEHLKQSQPPEGSVQGQYQIVVPQGIPSQATAGSSQGVLEQRAGRVPLKMPPGESSVQWQTDSGFDSSTDDVLGVDSSTNYRVYKSHDSYKHLRVFMSPAWAYTEEQIEFTVNLLYPLPYDVASYFADFLGKKAVELTVINPFTLFGRNPISQTDGEVTVSIHKVSKKEGFVILAKDLEFTYKNKVKELVKEVLGNEKYRNAAVEGLCSGLQSVSTGSDDLNAFRLPEAAPGHI